MVIVYKTYPDTRSSFGGRQKLQAPLTSWISLDNNGFWPSVFTRSFNWQLVRSSHKQPLQYPHAVSLNLPSDYLSLWGCLTLSLSHNSATHNAKHTHRLLVLVLQKERDEGWRLPPWWPFVPWDDWSVRFFIISWSGCTVSGFPSVNIPYVSTVYVYVCLF